MIVGYLLLLVYRFLLDGYSLVLAGGCCLCFIVRWLCVSLLCVVCCDMCVVCCGLVRAVLSFDVRCFMCCVVGCDVCMIV